MSEGLLAEIILLILVASASGLAIAYAAMAIVDLVRYRKCLQKQRESRLRRKW